MKNIQATGLLYNENITIKQISKTSALKLFKSGEFIYLQSSNMYPFGIWQSVCPIEFNVDNYNSSLEYYNYCKDSNLPLPLLHDHEYQFNDICSNFKYYNCDRERGLYIHYYIKIK